MTLLQELQQLKGAMKYAGLHRNYIVRKRSNIRKCGSGIIAPVAYHYGARWPSKAQRGIV